MPQPIDPSTEFLKMNAVERIQQALDRASLAAQSRQSASAAEDHMSAATVVQQSNARQPLTDDKSGRRNPYGGKRTKKDGPDDQNRADSAHTFYRADEHTEVVEDPENHDLDVTI